MEYASTWFSIFSFPRRSVSLPVKWNFENSSIVGHKRILNYWNERVKFNNKINLFDYVRGKNSRRYSDYVYPRQFCYVIIYINAFFFISATVNEDIGVCGWILTVLSWIVIALTCPFSLCLCLKVIASSFIN